MNHLQGKVVVTGASFGIGAVSKALAARDATIVAAARDQPATSPSTTWSFPRPGRTGKRQALNTARKEP